MKIGLVAFVVALTLASSVSTSAMAQTAPPTVPETRYAASAVWDDADGLMLLFGGCCEHGRLNDLWAYRPSENSWSQLSPNGPVPPPRQSASAVWDPAGRQMLVFGGSGADGVYFNDVWSYRPAGNSWTQLTAAAPLTPREGASVGWDSINQQLLVFGGRNFDLGGDLRDIHTGTLFDFWSYQPASDTWTQLDAPGIGMLAESPAAWDDTRGQLLVYGGNADELWSYQPNGDGWSHLLPPFPFGPDLWNLPGTDSAAAWDSSDGQMLFFGGRRLVMASNALWSYRPADNTWTAVDADGQLPQARGEAAAVWDSTDNQLLVFGGIARYAAEFQYFDDVWSYQPQSNSWTQLHPGGPDNGEAISLFRPVTMVPYVPIRPVIPDLRIPTLAPITRVPLATIAPPRTFSIPELVPVATATPTAVRAAPTATPTPVSVAPSPTPTAVSVAPSPTPTAVSVAPSPTPTLTAQQAIHQINDGPHGTVPAPALTGTCSGNTATVKVENQTPDSLSVYLAGPSSQTITIAPKDTTTLRLAAGTYDIGARVSDASVRPFSGSWNLGNCAYDSRFYIQTSP